MKKVFLGLLTFACVTAFASSALAAWDTCSVERTGVLGSDLALIKVTNCGTSANDGKWLSIGNQADRSLAVVLTAISLGKQIKLDANFAGANTTGSEIGAISTIYLNN